MNSVVIEHVPVDALPEEWRARLQALPNTRVTVRIEEEIPAPAAEALVDDPAFGLWRDRSDLEDVDAHVRRLREPRYRSDGSRSEE